MRCRYVYNGDNNSTISRIVRLLCLILCTLTLMFQLCRYVLLMWMLPRLLPPMPSSSMTTTLLSLLLFFFVIPCFEMLAVVFLFCWCVCVFGWFWFCLDGFCRFAIWYSCCWSLSRFRIFMCLIHHLDLCCVRGFVCRSFVICLSCRMAVNGVVCFCLCLAPPRVRITFLFRWQ